MFSITDTAVTVPAQSLQIGTTRHSDEGLDFLQALHRIDHLVAGVVVFRSANRPANRSRTNPADEFK
jgi:hypothetical protein